MKVLFAAAALAATAMAAAPLAANSIEEKNLLKGKEEISPDKGYIYLESNGRLFGTFLRVPGEEDFAAHTREREDRIAEAKADYEKKYAVWERKLEIAREKRWRLPKEPEKPDPENISAGPIELRDQVAFGPQYVFSSDETTDRYAYLTSARPGTYIWYGPISFNAEEGYGGICYCMGTVKFEVRPGVVTDLGDFLTIAPRFEQSAGADIEELRKLTVSGVLMNSSISLPETSGQPRFGLPASLADKAAPPVEFHAAGKLNNFHGVLVDRLPPIDGVLAYRRDTVIDVATGEALTVVPMARKP